MPTWDEVLQRDDLIGGDIESVEDGIVYRGPLESIRRENGIIYFTSPWTARMDPSQGEWEFWPINESFVIEAMPPSDIGDGRLHFSMPFLGYCTIFPRGGSKLDPAKVKGLDLQKRS